MSYVKRMVCLANSRKYAGRCIAGKEVLAQGFGSWVRPVSARTTTELARNERRYADGKDPKILDVMDVWLREPAPHGYQTENHLVEAARGYRRAGTVEWERVGELLDRPDTLWANGSSSYHGLNDRVQAEQAAAWTWSLALIAPQALSMRVHSEGGKPRVRAWFQYGGAAYVFSVTDPFAEWEWLAKPDGEYAVEGAVLCVSLGEPHTDGYCYKLVATVLTPPRIPHS
jgi:putative nucleic acid modification protein with dual OB domain